MARLSYALGAVPEGTRATNSVELELRGPGRLVGRVAVPRVRDAVAANLQKLKELLDRQAVGHTGGTDRRHPQVSNGQSRQVNGLVAMGRCVLAATSLGL
jgi:hypothetical protein